MRTTVTLDPDVAAKIRTAIRERGGTFKQVLNDALRLGLARGESSDARPYRLPSRALGLRSGVDLDHALRLAAALEDEETVRKLALRK